MGTEVAEDDLQPAPGATVTPPPTAEDHDLDFLKPGFRRPPPASDEDLQPAPGAEVVAPPEDAIGRANREYQANVAALKSPPAQQRNLPQTSGTGAVAAGLSQGSTLGWGDELAAHADSLISHIPVVRDVREAGANKLFGHPLGALPYNDPNLTYEQRRDAYRDYLAGARDQHGKLYTAGQIGGAIATAAIPGTSLAKGAGAIEAGGLGATLGGVTGAGESEATDAKDIAGDALKSGAIGGIGGAILHPIATKVVAPLAEKVVSKLAGKAATLADRQATAALTREASKTTAQAVTSDPNISAALNGPIETASGKSVTLGELAGKPAEQVRPILKAGREQVDQRLGELFGKSDAATTGKAGMTVLGAGQKRSGGADLADLAGHYDSRIAEAAQNPGNEKDIDALEGARQEALERWGPREAEIEAKHGELGAKTDELYDKSDAKSGGVTLGDLVKHRDDQITQLSKTPGNQAAIKALENSKQDIIRSWGTRPVFDATAPVEGGSFSGAKSGDAVAQLEKLAQQHPGQASALNAEAQRIRTAATKDGFDPTVKIPSKSVRAYATKLQNEAATDVADPKLAAKARQLLGSSTKDFVNGHVESVLGPKDRAALEALNKRTSNLYRWPDVVSGKEPDPAVRDAILKEFGTKVPTKAINDYAAKLEERGTQRIDQLNPGEASLARENLGKVTRDFANQHAAKTLSPEDQAEFDRLIARRASLNNIDKALKLREIGEKSDKTGLRQIVGRAAMSSPGIALIGHGTTKILTGDVGRGLAEVGSGALATAAPFAIKNARAIGRAAVRGVASGADYLAKVATAAEAGNPWARRMMDTLRQTPGGAARLAAALTRVRGGAAPAGGPPPVSEAP